MDLQSVEGALRRWFAFAAVALCGAAPAVAGNLEKAAGPGGPANQAAVTVAEPIAMPPAAPQPPAPEPATPAWLTALITATATLAAVFIANVFARQLALASMVQKANEAEMAFIDARLAGFLGPFMHLSAENLALSREMKRRYGGADFRTLPAMLEPGWLDKLSQGDRRLVSVVVENGLRLRQLILDHAGAVSPSLLPYFAAASTHFRLLDLANSGSLDMDPERYAAYVYPRQLDGVIDLERKRLEGRRELLRSRPAASHKPMPALSLTPDLMLPSLEKTASADGGAV